MASPGFDSIIPGLGRSILGGRWNKEPEAAEATDTRRSPRANERRSRSRGSSDIAEQVRLHKEAEQLEAHRSDTSLLNISPELRATLLRQANEEQMPPNRSQEIRRASNRGRPPNGSRGYQGRGRVASASRQPQLERKRRSEEESDQADKRPRGADSARGDRYPPRAGLDRYVPGEDRHRNNGPSQSRQSLQWINTNARQERSIPQGLASAQARGAPQQLPSAQNGQYQHMHPDRIAMSDGPNLQATLIQHLNDRPEIQRTDHSRHTVFNDSEETQTSTAAGFMDALRGDRHATVEWNPDPSDTDLSDRGVNNDVPIKGEPQMEENSPQSVDAPAINVNERANTEHSNGGRSKRPERLRFEFLEGLPSDEQISKMKGRMIILHVKASRLERDLTRTRAQLKLAKQARNTAETARAAAIKAQEEAESRSAPTSERDAELRQRLEATETAHEKAESAQHAAETARVEGEKKIKAVEKEKRKAAKDLKEVQQEMEEVKKELKTATKANKAAQKDKDEAEEAAQKAISEKERMAKRLEDLSSEHTLLMAETSNKEQLKKLQTELNQKSKEVVYLRNELASTGNADDGPSNHGELSRKYETALKKNEEQSFELAELRKTVNIKTEKIEKLKTRLAERGSTAISTSTPTTSTKDPEAKKALKQQKRELKEAHSAIEAEKQDKRELKKKFKASKTEIVTLKILLKQEEKRMKGVVRRLARELEAKGKLKERLARVRGEEDEDEDEEGSKDEEVSSASEHESTEGEDDVEDDDEEGSNDTEKDDGDDSGDGSEDSSEDSSDDDEDEEQQRSSSKSRGSVKVKTEPRPRSRSTSSQKVKPKKSRSKSRARSATRRA